MKRVKEFVKRKTKKHAKKLSLFLIIGIFKSLFSIGFTWLLIDILGMRALLGSAIVVVTVFFITYFAYITAKVIKPQFLKYAATTAGFNVATILLVWLFVDFLGLSGALSSTIVIGGLFILRYAFFSKIGIIRHNPI